MASQFDDSDFIDREYQSSETPYSGTSHHGGTLTFRPPSREELDARVGNAQEKLAALKRAQEALERERANLEEARRRRLEFQTGREEMLQHLTRGVGLLQQAEFNARRDAEQLAKTLSGLGAALGVVQGIQEETWTQENWNGELSKALAGIENARMEWNSARLKWPLLEGQGTPGTAAASAPPSVSGWWKSCSFLELCQLGLALTWPVALVGIIGLTLLLVLRTR